MRSRSLAFATAILYAAIPIPSFAEDTAQAASEPAATVAVQKSVRAKGEISFDDLKLDLEKDEAFRKEVLTDEVQSLHKQTLKLKGYILPTSVFQQKGIKQFVLVRDNQECCFGPGAAIYDCVIVEMVGDASVDFTTRVVTVKGKFVIDTETYKYPEGKHFAIYKMSATAAE